MKEKLIMKLNTLTQITFYLLVTIALSACQLGGSDIPQPIADAAGTVTAIIQTKVVETQGAEAQSTANAMYTAAANYGLYTETPSPTPTLDVPYETMVPTNTPTIQPMLATSVPIAKYCVALGGKWLSKYNDGIQFGGYLEREKLENGGLPMQPYLYQVNYSGITSVTWKNITMILDDKEEPFNDGGGTQLIGCQDALGVWRWYQADRKDNLFSLTSYLTIINGVPVGREHDNGDAGTWIGSPYGATITYTEVTYETLSSELSSHWEVGKVLIANVYHIVCENGCITNIWHKPE